MHTPMYRAYHAREAALTLDTDLSATAKGICASLLDISSEDDFHDLMLGGRVPHPRGHMRRDENVEAGELVRAVRAALPALGHATTTVNANDSDREGAAAAAGTIQRAYKKLLALLCDVTADRGGGHGRLSGLHSLTARVYTSYVHAYILI